MTESVTVTFLFSDIEGSSRMWELDLAGMDASLERHDRVLEAAVEKWHGRTFKTMGDAFCCAFEDAADALHAAVEAQLELARQSWPESIGPLRVRIGLNTGAAIRSETDFVGPALNRTARVMSSGHGGQILASSATVAVIGVPPEGIAFRDLGIKRLKDLEYPERIYQVIAAGLSASFPPLRTLDEHPNNLPTQLSSFVGRSREITSIGAALASSRVVTVAGSGAVGKTRLAIEVAARQVHRHPEGVFFIELASVADPSLLAHAVTSTIGIAETGPDGPETAFINWIGVKTVLIVLDNCEHLLEASATFVKRAATGCPNLTFLVTSREPLHIVGERVERLSPLAVPTSDRLEEIEQSDACRLFFGRAHDAGGIRSPLSAQDYGFVAAICRHLDGVPLAIELAATRVSAMPLSRLARDLDVATLMNKDPTAAARHHSIASAVSWSYELLNEAEKETFLSASAFRGCSSEYLSSILSRDVSEDLFSLADKSLVKAVAEGEASRYVLLESAREFALAKRESCGLLPELEQKRFALFREMAQAFTSIAVGRRNQVRVALTCEADNVRLTLEWAFLNRPIEAAAMTLELSSYWRIVGSFYEGRAWFERGLVASLGDALLHANLLRQAAGFAVMQDDYVNARFLANKALKSYLLLKNDGGAGAALHTLGEISHRRGLLVNAERYYARALPFLRAGGHQLGENVCLMNQGLVSRQKREFHRANALLKQAERLAIARNDETTLAQVQIERGWVILCSGDSPKARALFNTAVNVKLKSGDHHGVCQGRLGLATCALLLSEEKIAEESFANALEDATTLGVRAFISDALFGLSAVFAGRSEYENAMACWRLANAVSTITGDHRHLGVAALIARKRLRRETPAPEAVPASVFSASLQGAIERAETYARAAERG